MKTPEEWANIAEKTFQSPEALEAIDSKEEADKIYFDWVKQIQQDAREDGIREGLMRGAGLVQDSPNSGPQNSKLMQEMITMAESINRPRKRGRSET